MKPKLHTNSYIFCYFGTNIKCGCNIINHINQPEKKRNFIDKQMSTRAYKKKKKITTNNGKNKWWKIIVWKDKCIRRFYKKIFKYINTYGWII